MMINQSVDLEDAVSRRRTLRVESMAMGKGRKQEDEETKKKEEEKEEKKKEEENTEETVRFRKRQKSQRLTNSTDTSRENMNRETETSEEKPTSPVEGRCECCPYGYHIDLDFLRYLSSLNNGSQLSQSDQRRMRLHRKKLRRSMEFFLQQQEVSRRSLLLSDDQGPAQQQQQQSMESLRVKAADPTLLRQDESDKLDANRFMEEFDRTIEAQLASMNQGTSAIGVQATPALSPRYHAATDEDEDEDVLERRRFRTETEFVLSHHRPSSTAHAPPVDYDSCSSLSSGPSSPRLCRFSPRLHRGPLKATSAGPAPLRQQQQQQRPAVSPRSASLLANGTTALIQEITGDDRLSPPPPASVRAAEKTGGGVPPSSPDSNGLLPRRVVDEEAFSSSFPSSAMTQIRSSTLQAIRQQMAVSLERMRQLEEQVKMIPVLQVRLSILKEEKRNLTEELNTLKFPTNNDVTDHRNKIKDFADVKSGDETKSPHGGSSPGRRPEAPPKKHPTTGKPGRSVAVGDGLVFADAQTTPPSPPLYPDEMSTPADKPTPPACKKGKISRSISVGTDAVVYPTPPKNNNLFEVYDRELRTIYIERDATTAVAKGNARSVRNVGIMCRSAMRDVGVMHLSDGERPPMRSVAVGVGETGVDGSGGFGGVITAHASESKRIRIGDDQLRCVLDEMLRKTVHSVAVQCNGPATADSGVDACRLDDGGRQVSDVGCGEDRVDVDVTPKRKVRSVAIDNRPSVFHRACCTDQVLTVDASTNTHTSTRVTCDVSTNTDRRDSCSKATVTDCPVGRSISTEVETFFLGDFRQDAATNTDPVPPKSNSSFGTSTELTGDVQKPEAKPATVSRGTSTFGSSHSVDHRAVNTDAQSKADASTMTLNPPLQDRGCNTVRVRLMTSSTITNKLSCVSRAVGDPNSMLRPPETEHVDFKMAEALDGNGANLSTSPRSDEFSREPFNTKERLDDADCLTVKRFNATVDASLDHNSAPQSISTREEPSESDGVSTLASQTRTVPPTPESVETRRREHTFAFEGQPDCQPKSPAAALFESTPSCPYGADQRRLLLLRTESGSKDSGSESPFLSESDDSVRTECSATERHTLLNRKRQTSSEESESLAGETTKSAKNSVEVRQSSSGDGCQKVFDENFDDRSRDEDTRRRRIPPHDPYIATDNRSESHHRPAVDDTTSRESYDRFVDSFEVTIPALPATEAVAAVDATWAAWQKTAPLTGGDDATAGSTDASLEAFDRYLSEDNSSSSWSAAVEWPSGTSAFGDQSVTTTEEFTLSSFLRSVVDETDDDSDDVELPSVARTRLDDRRLVLTDNETDAERQSSEDTRWDMEAEKEEDKPESSGAASSAAAAASGGRSLKSIMKSNPLERREKTEKKELTFSEGVVDRYIPAEAAAPSDGDDQDSGSDGSRSTMSFDEGTYDSQLGQVMYTCKDDGGRYYVDLDDFEEDVADDSVFDQDASAQCDSNMRDIYEMSEEMILACTAYAGWLEGKDVTEEELNSSLGVIQNEWFSCSSQKLADASRVEDYLTQINEISQKLLENIVNSTDSNGNTALHYAISYRNLEVVNMILDTGACDVDRRNRAGYNAVMLASLSDIQTDRQRDVIRRLFDLGDVNQRALQAGQTALMLAVSHGDVSVVRMLLEAGAKVNAQDDDGSTALMCASEHGHFEIIKLLLAQDDCDASIVDNDGSTAVSIAMENGHKEIGILLYAHLNFKPSSPVASQRKVKKKNGMTFSPRKD